MDLGPALTDPVRLQLPQPEKTASGWKAHVTVIDRFGNCTTDLAATAIQWPEQVVFRMAGREVHGLVKSYGHRLAGDLVALVDSEGYLEIAVVNGSAAETLSVRVGDEVEVVESGRR
ncbi:MAG: SAM-dependent chlorinase/fluorinase [Chloroflexi bacterium]|nr:SAM-dependent chlorinase/fluorinase [Chloroflexota bacterium]